MDRSTAAQIADDVFRGASELASVPGIAYGLVHDGELVATGGRGGATLDGPVPGPDTVFRIASMTKSFTAAAVLLLRDEGRLRLDEPVATYVPAAATIAAPDGPALAVRDLLTMGGGLPTDDPWGDRQESLPAAAFDRLVAGGLSFSRPPRTGFEYSNTGYALLGRVIEEVTGTSYQDAVMSRLCAPLGMAATVFDPADIATDVLAAGYRIAADGSATPVPLVRPGSYSAMGGLHSTVRDLAVWIGAFLQSWGASTAHPAGRWALREAQELSRFVSLDESTGPGAGEYVMGYGFGLYVQEHRVLGRVISHSGGYPGFGSHMRWHPGSGWGVVALGNATYAPMHVAAREVLARLVLESGAAHGARPPVAVTPWPQTITAMNQVEDLLRGQPLSADEHTWSPNVDLDIPWDERLRGLSDVRDAIGAPCRVEGTVEHLTPAHAAWNVAGDAGSARVELTMTPEREPRIQGLVVKRVLGRTDGGGPGLASAADDWD